IAVTKNGTNVVFYLDGTSQAVDPYTSQFDFARIEGPIVNAWFVDRPREAAYVVQTPGPDRRGTIEYELRGVRTNCLACAVEIKYHICSVLRYGNMVETIGVRNRQ